MATARWSTRRDRCHCSASAVPRSRLLAAREQNSHRGLAHGCVTAGLLQGAGLVDPPVRPGPLVERGGASGAMLAAQAGRTRHVIVGHHWRLYRLQGLVGSVAAAEDVGTKSGLSRTNRSDSMKTHEGLAPSSAQV